MKLTAKVNGVQQEIELSKEDVYVVECGGNDKVNRVLKSIDKLFETISKWNYVSNKPLFKKCPSIKKNTANYSQYVTDYEPIPPNTPIISFQDWERLMESDKEEPKPTKWRFKTQKEFDDTCEKNDDGWYKCGRGVFFASDMYYLFGKEYAGSPDNLIGVDSWYITPEMLMPLDEEPKPTKWRFKTQKEFDDTCEKDEDGDYICGNDFFITSIFYLFGKEYDGSPDNLIRTDGWTITPEMLMPLEEVGEPNEKISFTNMGASFELTNSLGFSETKNYAFPVAPTQKWEKLTRGGIKVLDTQITFNDYIVVKAQKDDREIIYVCYPSGVNKYGDSNFDLIPLNRESILKEIEEHENKIKELKAKL